MDAVQEFLNMGGYAAYVWPSYGLAVVLLVGLVVITRQGMRRNERLLGQLQAAREARRAASSPSSSAEADHG
ncbi:heme exporter protein CcmD [Roseospirillum parvum]|uniref:Heme exporter protein D n=1 Tax=Roseospirillum parvum TaxID=83401 RepID=A0A1G8C3D6_9PROT|nr:heme exporter protein CcmD [Roseospirillum parvum]SDH39874.1 heme exporter protein D [Roseospirillum parvum]